jgi:hypothetical protein
MDPGPIAPTIGFRDKSKRTRRNNEPIMSSSASIALADASCSAPLRLVRHPHEERLEARVRVRRIGLRRRRSASSIRVGGEGHAQGHPIGLANANPDCQSVLLTPHFR